MLFGRIFPQLPPFAPVTGAVQSALLEVGAQGGIMDARDDLAASPKELIVDPTVNGQPDRSQPVWDQPGQPDDDGRLDVRRPVHRPRHHLRPDLAPRRDRQPADLGTYR
jgi:hypothetical protein